MTTVPVVSEVGMGAAGAMEAMHSEKKKSCFGTFKYTQFIPPFILSRNTGGMEPLLGNMTKSNYSTCCR